MTLSEIPKIRLINQQVSTSLIKSPKDEVSWMDAMQVQDYAISKAEIIRTHIMRRPTWHLVAAKDIHWMLVLTAKVKNQIKSRDKKLKMTDAVCAKNHKIIEKALANENHLTRDELTVLLTEENSITNDNRALHLLMRAKLDCIISNGSIKKQQANIYATF